MITKMKQNIAYLLCEVVGLLTFIFFALPYIAAFAKYSGYSQSKTLSGYKVMSELWENFGFGGVMSGIFQILVLVAGVFLLVYGACGLLKSFGVLKLTDKLNGVVCNKIAEIALFAYVAINILLVVFMIVLCVDNTETMSGVTVGIRFSAGVFVNLAVSLAVAVFAKILGKKWS